MGDFHSAANRTLLLSRTVGSFAGVGVVCVPCVATRYLLRPPGHIGVFFLEIYRLLLNSPGFCAAQPPFQPNETPWSRAWLSACCAHLGVDSDGSREVLAARVCSELNCQDGDESVMQAPGQQTEVNRDNKTSDQSNGE